MPRNAAIQYAIDMVDTSRAHLLGRHSAGEGLLKAYVQHSGADKFYAVANNRKEFEDFRARVERLDPRKREPVWVAPHQIDKIAECGAIHMHGPQIPEMAWIRRRGDARAFSICGITHTTASRAVMDFVGKYAIAPLQEWDALICTSRAVRTSLEGVLERWCAYLQERTGARPAMPVQFPVIPLGVDCTALAEPGAAARKRWRAKLGIADGDVAVLFMGRLSFHAKAHPIPMYMAIERAAAAAAPGRVHLIQAGWFAGEAIEKSFREAAQAFMPSANALFVDGRPADARYEIWAAADVFCSLSDNVQETYGLTPVEAMAAGLPCVVSDWNGYRDTVRNGQDGYTVPTALAAPGTGMNIAMRYHAGSDSYDRYIGQAGQFAAVDIGATAAALARLFKDAGHRRALGASGQARARSEFDWPVVIRRYQELWEDLAARRAAAEEIAPKKGPELTDPLGDDPFATFACYPTFALEKNLVLTLAPEATVETVNRLKTFSMTTLAAQDMPPVEHMEVVIRTLREYGPAPAGDLLQLFPAQRQPGVARGLAWMAKFGLLSFAPAEAAAAPAPGKAA